MTDNNKRITNQMVVDAIRGFDAKLDAVCETVQNNKANIMVLARTSNGYAKQIEKLEDRERQGAIERAKYVGLGAVIGIIPQVLEQIRAFMLR